MDHLESYHDQDCHDGLLLTAWRERQDQDALAELIARQRPMVEGICRRLLRSSEDCADVVQETFIAFTSQASVIRGQPGAWLRTVATNRALNHGRAQQRRRLHEARSVAPVSVSQPSVLEDLVEPCLAELDAGDRQLLVRLFFHGETQAEVARADQLTRLTVHRRVQRALGCMRQRLAGRGVRVGAAALALALAGGDRVQAAEALAPARTVAAMTGTATVAALLALGLAWGWYLHARGSSTGAGEPAAGVALAEVAGGARSGAIPASAVSADSARQGSWPAGIVLGGGIPGRHSSPRLDISHLEVETAGRTTDAGGRITLVPRIAARPVADCSEIQPLEVRFATGAVTALWVRPPSGCVLILNPARRLGLHGNEIEMAVVAPEAIGFPAGEGAPVLEPDPAWLVNRTYSLSMPGRRVLTVLSMVATSDGQPPWSRWAWGEESGQTWPRGGVMIGTPLVVLGIAFRDLDPAEQASLAASCPAPEGYRILTPIEH